MKYLYYESLKLAAKLKKLKAFWEMYLKWCRVLEETANNMRDKS